MARRSVAAPAPAMPIAEALQASPALGRLGERLRLSREMLGAVAPLLPANLAAHVAPGPLDEEGWSMLCANAAVAAKLRQLVPRLEQRLEERGLIVPAVRIKVLPR